MGPQSSQVSVEGTLLLARDLSSGCGPNTKSASFGSCSASLRLFPSAQDNPFRPKAKAKMRARDLKPGDKFIFPLLILLPEDEPVVFLTTDEKNSITDGVYSRRLTDGSRLVLSPVYEVVKLLF